MGKGKLEWGERIENSSTFHFDGGDVCLQLIQERGRLESTGNACHVV